MAGICVCALTEPRKVNSQVYAHLRENKESEGEQGRRGLGDNELLETTTGAC